MFEIKKIKTENGELGISFVIQTSTMKQKYSDVVSVFCNTKERIEQRIKLVHIALQVLRANPETISLEKKGRKNQLSLAWKDSRSPSLLGSFRPLSNSIFLSRATARSDEAISSINAKIKKIRKKINGLHYKDLIKKKIVKVATGVSAIALIVCASAALMPFINATNGTPLCANDVDVVLMMDTSESMADGSKCEWTEMRPEVEGGPLYLFLNIKYDVTEQWCIDVRDEFDKTSNYYFQPIDPTYTPSKIELAKIVAKEFVSKLGPNDKSALVFFNDIISLNKQLSNEHLGDAPSTTETAINDLIAGTTDDTDIAGAIDAANIELDTRANVQAIKAMILLTDGQDTNTIAVETARDQAAALGYKIFTIGLGNDVDATMLSSIAEITGAKKIDGSVGYYPAADGSELADIYDQIATAICQYGSISGCKYLDANNNSIIDDGEEKLPDWQINLSGAFSATQQTDETGCYTFAGLLPGTYNVSEILPEGEDWQQTYPNDSIEGSLEGSWIVNLNQEDNIIEKHFANYFPCDDGNVCTDDNYDPEIDKCVSTENSVECDDEDACTIDDICSGGECSGTPIVCDDEDFCTTDACVDGECVYTPMVCDDEDPCTTDACVDGECVYTPMDCDDGIECTEDSCVNGSCQHDTSACTCSVDADCDDSNPCTDNTCNLETYTCEEPIDNTNQCDDSDACTTDDICSGGDCSGTPMVCDDGDPCTTDTCVDGECVYTPIVCDDGIECTIDSCVDGECQYDDSNCPTEPEPEPEPTPPSSGGAVIIPHSVSDVGQTDVGKDSVTITWRTSFFATSQVIYSIEGEIHNFDPDNLLMYGYAHITAEYDTDPKVTFHKITIKGLNPDEVYYYRTISRASPAVFSPEFTFTTLASLEEDDASETDETQEQESATAEDSSDEFVPDESAASEELSLDEVEEKLNEISNKVATIGQEVAKISPRVNVPAFASVDSSAESLASNDLDSEADDEEPLFADATADKASFAEGTTNKVNNEINDELDNSKFLAGIGTFFSNLEGWRLALIFLLGIILALIILRLVKSLVGGNKNK